MGLGAQEAPQPKSQCTLGNEKNDEMVYMAQIY